MSWELVLKHCAAVKMTAAQARVSLELLEAQVAGLEALARQQQQPRATIERPASCQAFKDEDCARVCDDAAIELGGMGGGPRSIMCRGCGETLPAIG